MFEITNYACPITLTSRNNANCFRKIKHCYKSKPSTNCCVSKQYTMYLQYMYNDFLTVIEQDVSYGRTLSYVQNNTLTSLAM